MRLVLSGGGTGGHIIPNIALIHELRARAEAEGTALDLLYIGSSKGMEGALIEEQGVEFVGITCGKLRRYVSLKNFVDVFRVPYGILQAVAVLLKFRPDVIFCKGGYVSFPVAVAGWVLRVPVVLHESDVSPGLANRMCARFASVICVSFEESKKYFERGRGARTGARDKKIVFTGNPVRRELAQARKENGFKFLNFTPDLPVVLIMGGSKGADYINRMTLRNLEYLLPHYQVAHICGHGHVLDCAELLKHLKPEHQKYLSRYRTFGFLQHELKDVYAAADVVVSRAGAISLAELDFFEKPVILIPLGKKVSRGDQILNAEVFAKDHLCKILFENEFSDAEFLEDVQDLLKHRKSATVGHGTHKGEDKFYALEKIIKLLQKPCA